MSKSKIASLIIVILSIPFLLSGCGGSGGGSGSGDTSSSMGTAAGKNNITNFFRQLIFPIFVEIRTAIMYRHRIDKSTYQ